MGLAEKIFWPLFILIVVVFSLRSFARNIKDKKELKNDNILLLDELKKKILDLKNRYENCKKNYDDLMIRGERDLFKRINYFKDVNIKSIEEVEQAVNNIKVDPDWRGYGFQLRVSRDIGWYEERVRKLNNLLSEIERPLKKIEKAKEQVYLKINEIYAIFNGFDSFIEKHTEGLPEAYKNLVKSKKQELIQMEKEVDGLNVKINWFYYQAKLETLTQEVLLFSS